MDKNNPGSSVSRTRVTPIKIGSIYIDFRGYKKHQDDGNSHHHSSNRETSVGLSENANDSANTTENGRKNPGDFSMRKYVAEKIRERYAVHGELLAIEPNSNEAPANMDKSLTCANRLGTTNSSSIHNTTVTTGLDDGNQQIEKKTLEDPKGALSLSEGLGVHLREENPVVTEVRNAYPAITTNLAVRRKKHSCRKRTKVHLLSDIYKRAKPIGERPTTTFQVVNVIEDFNLEQEEEEEECSNIRIRRRKHARKAININ